MTGAAILINPDTGSTRPGATASQDFSSAGSVVAARAGACAYVDANGNASAVAITPRLSAANQAVLSFGVIMTSAPSVGCCVRRVLLSRSARLRCARHGRRTTGCADRG